MTDNITIHRKEFRETITFSDLPTVETCKALRASGYDFDRRNGVWYRKALESAPTTEQALVARLQA